MEYFLQFPSQAYLGFASLKNSRVAALLPHTDTFGCPETVQRAIPFKPQPVFHSEFRGDEFLMNFVDVCNSLQTRHIHNADAKFRQRGKTLKNLTQPDYGLLFRLLQIRPAWDAQANFCRRRRAFILWDDSFEAILNLCRRGAK